MRCPACQTDAVAGAAFCNYCGVPMPVVCRQCAATNPSLSNFCHRCGATISSVEEIPHRAASVRVEPTLRDVATDFKVLAVDTARYSAPRIRTAAIFVGRATRRSAAYAASGIKNIGTAIARRANRPSPTPEAPAPAPEPPLVEFPGPEPPPGESAVSARPPAGFPAPAGATPSPPPDTPVPEPPPADRHAMACPRCRAVNQAGSIFCFNCGLPLDEATPAARPSPYYQGRPAGFWVRLAAALIDIEPAAPPDLDVHLIADNYSTHKTALIRKWLAKRPRFHLRFTPTSASWLILEERCFSVVSSARWGRARSGPSPAPAWRYQ